MNGKEEIWDKVEAFRREHLVGGLRQLPVDVFSLVELRLGLDVIPFDDLFAKYDSDAAITQDFTGIYVDTEAYVFWEKGPVWKQNRLLLAPLLARYNFLPTLRRIIAIPTYEGYSLEELGLTLFYFRGALQSHGPFRFYVAYAT